MVGGGGGPAALPFFLPATDCRLLRLRGNPPRGIRPPVILFSRSLRSVFL